MSAGEDGLARLVAGGSSEVAGGDLLVGGEARTYDGPWDRAQEIRKVSALARYSRERGSSGFSLLAMAYRNTWNATDQIPRRAVDRSLIGRFGHIDATDGGETRRYSLSGHWRHVGAASVQEVQLFGIYSDLSLFSNFEYFLTDPVRGDQFNQREERLVIGGNARHIQPAEAFGVGHVFTAGAQSRADFLRPVGLYRTQERARVGTIREDEVSQWSGGVFLEAESR